MKKMAFMVKMESVPGRKTIEHPSTWCLGPGGRCLRSEVGHLCCLFIIPWRELSSAWVRGSAFIGSGWVFRLVSLFKWTAWTTQDGYLYPFSNQAKEGWRSSNNLLTCIRQQLLYWVPYSLLSPGQKMHGWIVLFRETHVSPQVSLSPSVWSEEQYRHC